jgi:hypothetical protein
VGGVLLDSVEGGVSTDDRPIGLLHLAAALCPHCTRLILCQAEDAPMLTCCCFCGTKMTPGAKKETIQ